MLILRPDQDIAERIRFIQYLERVYTANGRNTMAALRGPFQRTAGIARHTFTPAVASTGSGSMTGGPYRYVIAPIISTEFDADGENLQGCPGSVSDAVTVTSAASITISSIPAAYSADSGIPYTAVDKWRIFRTASGDYTSESDPSFQGFYFVKDVAIGTTSTTDSLDDATLQQRALAKWNCITPPSCKFILPFADRLLAGGFKPISSGTVSSTGSTNVLTFTTAKPDGIIGCKFKGSTENIVYAITKRTSSTVWEVDRTVTTAFSGASYVLYRSPREVYASEYRNYEYWGPNGEAFRWKRELPRGEGLKGLAPHAQGALCFTGTNVYLIYGNGPDISDIKMRPDPFVKDFGCVASETITPIEDKVIFLSQWGLAQINPDGTCGLFTGKLNTDWLEGLSDTVRELCVAHGDRRYFALWYPDSNSAAKANVGFSCDRESDFWTKERGMRPQFAVKEPVYDGADNPGRVLFADGGNLIEPDVAGGTDGTFSETFTATISSVTATFTTVASVSANQLVGYPLWLWSLSGGVYTYVGWGRINSHTTGTSITATLTYGPTGLAPANGSYFAAVGYFPTEYYTSILQIPGGSTQARHTFIELAASTPYSIYRDDFVDGVQAANTQTISGGTNEIMHELIDANLAARSLQFKLVTIPPNYDSGNGGIRIRRIVMSANATGGFK